MANKKNTTLGKGWSFPPTFDLNRKTVSIVTGVEDIKQSLSILFGTRKGERILTQNYGCDINLALFQNISLTDKTLIENKIQNAIINYEARINLHSVKIDTSQLINGLLHIQVDFSIRTTNSRHNIVYPYYIGEGTLLTSEIW